MHQTLKWIWLDFLRALEFASSHIYGVNHRLAFDKRADEPFIKAPNPYDDKQGWLRNQNNLSEPIWQVGSIFQTALVCIVDSVEQERE